MDTTNTATTALDTLESVEINELISALAASPYLGAWPYIVDSASALAKGAL
jgi:hypothetical protein